MLVFASLVGAGLILASSSGLAHLGSSVLSLTKRRIDPARLLQGEESGSQRGSKARPGADSPFRGAPTGAVDSQPASPRRVGKTKLTYTNLPLRFEPLTSRTPRPDGFTAAGRGYRLSLLPQEARLDFFPSDNHLNSPASSLSVRVLDANSDARGQGVDPQSTAIFYYRGNDPRRWQRKAPNYAKVRYHNLYPGVDLVYYGNQKQLEYDFEIAPGADPGKIQLEVAGARQVRVDDDGDLVLAAEQGEVLLQKPRVYQMKGAARKEVKGNFRIDGTRVSFALGAYNKSLALVIDPTLNYATYVGRTVNDQVNAIALGADGSTYVAGLAAAPVAEGATVSASTASGSAPAAGTAAPPIATGGSTSATAPAAQNEAFVAHISADGKTLLSMTYLGGSNATEALGLAIDPMGNAYITGVTAAPDFPVQNALQNACALDNKGVCEGQAFVAKLNPDGSLNFATFLGGSGTNAGNALALDGAGNIYVAGSTTSIDFPVEAAAQPVLGGASDAFVAKFSNDGSQMLFATYLGGLGADQALGIALDSSSNIYITGQTQSEDFPTVNPLQTMCSISGAGQCAGEAFVAKLATDGSQFFYSTYLGGSGGDSGNAIAVDEFGYAYVTGQTSSRDFPVLGAYQPQAKGSSQAFISKLKQDGSGLVYSTYLGGSATDLATSIAVDIRQHAIVSGQTTSADFPTLNPIQAQCRMAAAGGCSQDAFLADLNIDGKTLLFSTYLGGSGADVGRGLAIDTKGSAYLGGATTSADFPMALPVSVTAETSVLSLSRQNEEASPSASTGAPALNVPEGGGVVALITGLPEQSSQSCPGSTTISWTGTGDGVNWTTAGNWSTGVLPVSTDVVCIGPSFDTNTITIGSISSSTNQTITSLVSNASISFTSGPLTTTAGADFVNALSVSGGTLTLSGTSGSSVGETLAQSGGTITGTDSLSIAGLFTWTGGNLSTSGTTTASGGSPFRVRAILSWRTGR